VHLQGYEGGLEGGSTAASLTRSRSYFEDLVTNADRVFYFDESPRAETRIIARSIPRTQKSQTARDLFP
jgi:hypothetical protein